MVTQRGRSAADSNGAVPPPRLVPGQSLGGGFPWTWRWLLPVAVAAATAAWLSGVMSGRATGGLRILLMVCGALFTATAAGVPLWQQARASRAQADAVTAAQAARAATRVAMQDALDPFAELLCQLAAARPQQKPLLRGEAIQLALTTIAHLSDPGGIAGAGPARLRVCYFALERQPRHRLVPQAYAGRSGAVTVSFDRSTRAGQFLFRILYDGWTIVDDMTHLHVPVWWDEEGHYRTFAAGPVAGPSGPAGLLVVDALAPGELAALDLPLLRLIAHLLFLALQV